MEGAGVRLKRIFGFGDTALTDPFLLLDHFGSNDPADYMAGFPWHPHRGIETVTYMLEGVVEHMDSMGNRGTIGAGQVQWMTAGSGIVHQEMPQPMPGIMRGFQLWVNLPAASKMTAPRYRDIHAEDIPSVQQDGAQVQVISGTFAGVPGPAKDIIAQPWYFDVGFLRDDPSLSMSGSKTPCCASLSKGTGGWTRTRCGSSHPTSLPS